MRISNTTRLPGVISAVAVLCCAVPSAAAADMHDHPRGCRIPGRELPLGTEGMPALIDVE
ncbi:hypothetical protein ACIBSV_30075 [Embleya sp. NPDC050154]|uniref:hypothetical protein n=1 Tax=unclassified Embleya TaxID=2699296 RepID=UPI0037A2F7B8